MTAGPVVIRLGGAPVGKGRPRFVRATGAAFTPKRTRDYEAALRLAATEVMEGRPPLQGAVSAIITATFPIPRSWPKRRKQRAELGLEYCTTRPDADNIIKALDALNEIVMRDDAQIAVAAVCKLYGSVASLVIEIRPLAAERSSTLSLDAAPSVARRRGGSPWAVAASR